MATRKTFRDYVLRSYDEAGLPTPNFANHEYAYWAGDEWERAKNWFYNAFADEYHIPRDAFLFQWFRDADMAVLRDSDPSKVTLQDLVTTWLLLALRLQPEYPELTQWMWPMSTVIPRPPWPQTTLEEDLGPLHLRLGELRHHPSVYRWILDLAHRYSRLLYQHKQLQQRLRREIQAPSLPPTASQEERCKWYVAQLLATDVAGTAEEYLGKCNAEEEEEEVEQAEYTR